MTDNVQTLAHQLADAKHELDCHLWQSQSPFNDALFIHSEEIRASIPDEIYFTPQFVTAYEARRAERSARAERGSPFAVINGGAS